MGCKHKRCVKHPGSNLKEKSMYILQQFLLYVGWNTDDCWTQASILDHEVEPCVKDGGATRQKELGALMITRFPCKPQVAYICIGRNTSFTYATVLVLLSLLSSLASEPHPN